MLQALSYFLLVPQIKENKKVFPSCRRGKITQGSHRAGEQAWGGPWLLPGFCGHLAQHLLQGALPPRILGTSDAVMGIYTYSQIRFGHLQDQGA